MFSTGRLLAAGILGGLFSVSLAAAPQTTLADLFQKGKTEFKMGSYSDSLATFDALERQLALPENEPSRQKLTPLIAFYRGANLAASGQKKTAVVQFQKYMEAFPDAKVDPSMFPRPVMDAFDEAKKGSRTEVGSRDVSPMAADFERFRRNAIPLQLDDHWADGAIHYLMTTEERQTWSRIGDERDRAEFVAKFWERRDPTPETHDNEFRTEVESRVRFADTRFSQEEKKGSESDRGMVFVLMGPPSYVGQKPFRAEDDPLQSARNAPIKETHVNSDGSTTTLMVPRIALTAQTIQGNREIWYYRKDRLPKQVRFSEVDFEFLTRKGLGINVLQRDHDILTTLDQVARASIPGGRN